MGNAGQTRMKKEIGKRLAGSKQKKKTCTARLAMTSSMQLLEFLTHGSIELSMHFVHLSIGNTTLMNTVKQVVSSNTS
jgi:hypothetical protein